MKKIICTLLCLALALSSFPAFAVSQAEIDALEAQRDELQSRQNKVGEQLDALRLSQESSLAQKALLDEQSVLLWQETELLREQIVIYEAAVADKKSECKKADKNKQEHYKLYCSRVRDMEEASAWNYLSYILKADSISSLISRISDISDIMSYDEKLRSDYIAACEAAAAALGEYEELLAAQRAKEAELELQQAELEEKIAQSAAVLAALEEDIDTYMSFQEEMDSELAKVQAEIDKKAEELRKQQEAERLQNHPAPGITVGSGYYMWPSATTYITSPFGPRVHPIYGQLKPHTGVDIGAWYGTEIYAAASGTVSMAVVDYGTAGYGTYVAIYHPNGTTTLYGHMSSLAVSAGQNVSKGQVIGYVGSTGASNGPHIHFEIRQNGLCVDPMLYF